MHINMCSCQIFLFGSQNADFFDMVSSQVKSTHITEHMTYISQRPTLSHYGMMGNTLKMNIDSIVDQEIPFLKRTSGFSTEVGTDRTSITTSYTKTERIFAQPIVSKKMINAKMGDTKVGVPIPFFPDIQVFGGYSYNKNEDDTIIKGPSFGFKADLAKYVKLDTTFIKQSAATGRRTSTNVMLSVHLDMNTAVDSFKKLFQ